jgi:hypothetical protein
MAKVRFSVALEEQDAWQLAQFIKRMRYDQAYELTEAHLRADERALRAEAMIRGLMRVWDALNEVGVEPR